MLEMMILNSKEVYIMSNMKYIFENADIRLDKQQAERLEKAHARALKLKKHNGALLSGLTNAAACWLKYAYEHNVPVNQKAYEDCVWDLEFVDIPDPYDAY